MIGSENLSSNLPGQSSHLALVHVAESMEILVEESVEDVRVEIASILGQPCDLVEKAAVHHNKVGSHLMEGPDIVRQISEPKHQSDPPFSKARLDRSFD